MMIESLIFGICFTISVEIWMIGSKLDEVKEALNEIADALEQNRKEQE